MDKKDNKKPKLRYEFIEEKKPKWKPIVGAILIFLFLMILGNFDYIINDTQIIFMIDNNDFNSVTINLFGILFIILVLLIIVFAILTIFVKKGRVLYIILMVLFALGITAIIIFKNPIKFLMIRYLL